MLDEQFKPPFFTRDRAHKMISLKSRIEYDAIPGLLGSGANIGVFEAVEHALIKKTGLFHRLPSDQHEKPF